MSSEYSSDAEDVDEIKNIPGPGHYFNEKWFSSFQKKIVPREKQYFGSRCMRFKNEKPTIERNRYESTLQNLKKKPKKANAPFENKSKRFDYGYEISPGPGSYSDQTNFGSLEKKV